jgi:hypothetical protein
LVKKLEKKTNLVIIHQEELEQKRLAEKDPRYALSDLYVPAFMEVLPGKDDVLHFLCER